METSTWHIHKWDGERTLIIETLGEDMPMTVGKGLVIPYPADPMAAAMEWADVPRQGWELKEKAVKVHFLWLESLRQKRRMIRLEYRFVLHKTMRHHCPMCDCEMEAGKNADGKQYCICLRCGYVLGRIREIE